MNPPANSSLCSLCNYKFNALSRAILTVFDFEQIREVCFDRSKNQITIIPIEGQPLVIHIIGEQASLTAIVDLSEGIENYGAIPVFAVWANDFDDFEDAVSLAQSIHFEEILSIVLIEGGEGEVHCVIDPNTAESLNSFVADLEEI